MEGKLRWPRHARRVALAAAAIGGTAVLAAASNAAGPPTADMAVTALTGPATPVKTGQLVWFTQVIRNDGPQKVEMDTVVRLHGGRVTQVVCALGISSDGTNCEYGFIPPGTHLKTKYQVRVTATEGGLAFSGGVTTEQPELDDNPFNQYLTVSIPIGD